MWRDPDGNPYHLPTPATGREVISDFNATAWVIVSALLGHWDATALGRPVKVRVGDWLPRQSHQLRTLTVAGV